VRQDSIESSIESRGVWVDEAYIENRLSARWFVLKLAVLKTQTRYAFGVEGRV